MCMYDNGEYSAEFHSEVTRKARKRHKCGECERFIEPGENYERVVGKWDGEISTYLTCEHCVAARGWLSHECGGWLYEMVEEDLQEHVPKIRGAKGYIELLRLVIGMKNSWKKFFEPGLMPVPELKNL